MTLLSTYASSYTTCRLIYAARFSLHYSFLFRTVWNRSTCLFNSVNNSRWVWFRCNSGVQHTSRQNARLHHGVDKVLLPASWFISCGHLVETSSCLTGKQCFSERSVWHRSSHVDCCWPDTWFGGAAGIIIQRNARDETSDKITRKNNYIEVHNSILQICSLP